MMNDYEFTDLAEALRDAPEFVRNAVAWLILHIDTAERICNPEYSIPEEELFHIMESARSAQDYALFGIASYQAVIQRQYQAQSKLDTPDSER